MARSHWEADKMLDVYIYDYLVKRNLHVTARAFMNEGKVAADPVAIDAPGGFLFEWWSIFWDIYDSRTKRHPDVVNSSADVQQAALLQRRGASSAGLSREANAVNSDSIAGQTSASVLDRAKSSIAGEVEAPVQMLNASRYLKSTINHPGPLLQGNTNNMLALQQMQSRSQQADIKPDISVSQRALTMDPSALYAAGLAQAKTGFAGGGLNQGIGNTPLKGYPLMKQFISPQNQFQLLSPQQQAIALTLSQTDPFRMGSPIQSGSPKNRADQTDYQSKMLQGSSSQHHEMQLQQQQPPLHQNSRKRKPTSSGAANSTGTGNTLGPASPLSPSTHTPGDAVPPSAPGPNILSRNSIIYGRDGATGMGSSNQMDNFDSFDFVDNVDSFLHDDVDANFGQLKRHSAEHNSDSTKGSSLNEIGCSRLSNSKVLCCHFSTDGKLLASAGHDKKIFIWNMEDMQTEIKSEEHTNFITDIRFRPNSAQLATSSSDGTVRLWNATDRSNSVQTFLGHSSQVTSLDFHPKKQNVLCSCDDNGEVRFWNVGQTAPSRVSKVKQGSTGKVRFQSRSGIRLAAAVGNMVNIVDVETDAMAYPSLKGHNSEVHSFCWDETGDYLASVSQDFVKVWSVSSGECIYELRSNGNNYYCCAFHPLYPKILILGSYQSLELWSIGDDQRMPFQAHEGLVSALAQSPANGYIASASHDRTVKIWK